MGKDCGEGSENDNDDDEVGDALVMNNERVVALFLPNPIPLC